MRHTLLLLLFQLAISSLFAQTPDASFNGDGKTNLKPGNGGVMMVK